MVIRNLSARIVLSSKAIQQVDLTLTKGPELRWEIVGEGSPELRKQVEQWLAAYSKGDPIPAIPRVELDSFSPFTRRVLMALQEIAFGQTVTYSSLAAQLGSPRASRAVGSACGRNPVPLFIPCHRVLAIGNKLGGFSCGLAIKRALLEHERSDQRNFTQNFGQPRGPRCDSR